MTANSLCSECGSSFSCGAGDTSNACWCTELPALLPPLEGRTCLCPACLKAKVQLAISEFVSDVKAGKRENTAASFQSAEVGSLVSDIDFYIEDGRYVFTAWFHLKRGDCCGSSCRHCPYEHRNVP